MRKSTAIIAMAIFFALGMFVASKTNETKAVCYATTEDSVITGCDYRNGAWYRK